MPILSWIILARGFPVCLSAGEPLYHSASQWSLREIQNQVFFLVFTRIPSWQLDRKRAFFVQSSSKLFAFLFICSKSLMPKRCFLGQRKWKVWQEMWIADGWAALSELVWWSVFSQPTYMVAVCLFLSLPFNKYPECLLAESLTQSPTTQARQPYLLNASWDLDFKINLICFTTRAWRCNVGLNVVFCGSLWNKCRLIWSNIDLGPAAYGGRGEATSVFKRNPGTLIIVRV